MEDIGKPVPENLEELDKIIQETMEDGKHGVDFDNTEIAFKNKSDDELKKMARLFRLMNNYWLVTLGTKLGIAAIKLRLPFVKRLVRHTVFEQFCGGTTLLEASKISKRLAQDNVLTILDYGAEGKHTEQAFNHTMNEIIRAIEFAAQDPNIPMISMKISGLAKFELLEKVQKDEDLSESETEAYQNAIKRVDAICHTASQRNIGVYFDAEESWIQDTIDHLVNKMMKRYNKNRAIVNMTLQMYRTDRLKYLIEAYNHARQQKYILGVKLVRGAYVDKERKRAKENGYESPIFKTKEATDDAYNTAIKFCVDNYEHIETCNATHNVESCLMMAQLIVEKKIPKNHRHMLFSQLYGMSDNLTFNLAAEGYNVAKYMPYGPVMEVVPYLIRRAEENTSITGDMSREYKMVVKELKRRGIA